MDNQSVIRFIKIAQQNYTDIRCKSVHEIMQATQTLIQIQCIHHCDVDQIQTRSQAVARIADRTASQHL